MKRKVDCGKFSHEFNSVTIGAHRERPALQQGQIHAEKLIPHFQQESNRASSQAGISRSLVLTRINLNQKMIAAIDTADGSSRSTLGDYLITSHQAYCMSSALILVEAVENGQEHITSCSSKLGSIMPLV